MDIILPQDQRNTQLDNHPMTIAVLLPCFNEEVAIAGVVLAFRKALPTADIYVYDNNSTDRTVEVANSAGAITRTESRQGKGNVLRRMFADVEADVYILADGDGTYDASVAGKLLEKFSAERLDFLNASRVDNSKDAYRPGHRFGNWLLTTMVHAIFGRQINDMLSGYKVLSRRFVKSFPAMSTGFETETELMVHALELRVPMGEVPTHYSDRAEGSASKLRTFRDGFRILLLIARLVKDERPLQLFGAAGLLSIALGFLLGIDIVVTFVETGLVPRLPTAVLSVAVVILGFMSIFAGLIMQIATRSRQEMKRLFYLSQSH